MVIDQVSKHVYTLHIIKGKAVEATIELNISKCSLFSPFLLLDFTLPRRCRCLAALSGVLLLSSAFCYVLRTAGLKRWDVGGHLMRRQTEHEVRVAK